MDEAFVYHKAHCGTTKRTTAMILKQAQQDEGDFVFKNQVDIGTTARRQKFFARKAEALLLMKESQQAQRQTKAAESRFAEKSKAKKEAAKRGDHGAMDEKQRMAAKDDQAGESSGETAKPVRYAAAKDSGKKNHVKAPSTQITKSTKQTKAATRKLAPAKPTKRAADQPLDAQEGKKQRRSAASQPAQLKEATSEKAACRSNDRVSKKPSSVVTGTPAPRKSGRKHVPTAKPSEGSSPAAKLTRKRAAEAQLGLAEVTEPKKSRKSSTAELPPAAYQPTNPSPLPASDLTVVLVRDSSAAKSRASLKAKPSANAEGVAEGPRPSSGRRSISLPPSKSAKAASPEPLTNTPAAGTSKATAKAAAGSLSVAKTSAKASALARLTTQDKRNAVVAVREAKVTRTRSQPLTAATESSDAPPASKAQPLRAAQRRSAPKAHHEGTVSQPTKSRKSVPQVTAKPTRPSRQSMTEDASKPSKLAAPATSSLRSLAATSKVVSGRPPTTTVVGGEPMAPTAPSGSKRRSAPSAPASKAAASVASVLKGSQRKFVVVEPPAPKVTRSKSLGASHTAL